jgi:hypothetical protein
VNQKQQVLDVVAFRTPIQQLHEQGDQWQENEHRSRQVVNDARCELTPPSLAMAGSGREGCCAPSSRRCLVAKFVAEIANALRDAARFLFRVDLKHGVAV